VHRHGIGEPTARHPIFTTQSDPRRVKKKKIWSGQGATHPALDATSKLGTRCSSRACASLPSSSLLDRAGDKYKLKPERLILCSDQPHPSLPLHPVSTKFAAHVRSLRKMGKTWALITHLHSLAGYVCACSALTSFAKSDQRRILVSYG
jgi:hypothetical protein